GKRGRPAVLEPLQPRTVAGARACSLQGSPAWARQVKDLMDPARTKCGDDRHDLALYFLRTMSNHNLSSVPARQPVALHSAGCYACFQLLNTVVRVAAWPF